MERKFEMTRTEAAIAQDRATRAVPIRHESLAALDMLKRAMAVLAMNCRCGTSAACEHCETTKALVREWEA